MGYYVSRKKPNVLAHQLSSVNFSTTLCPDQYLCRAQYNQVTSKWELANKSYICNRRFSHSINKANYVNYSNIADDNYLIIILESPHKDEYDANGKPYGPAQGKTGCNICTYLEDCLNSQNCPLNQLIDYQIVLVNAVQFQASAGTCPLDKTLRNQNWKNLFTACGDLNQRINRFVSKNGTHVVSNCCTYCLKDNVTKLLSKTPNYYVGNHPISWINENYRKLW